MMFERNTAQKEVEQQRRSYQIEVDALKSELKVRSLTQSRPDVVNEEEPALAKADQALLAGSVSKLNEELGLLRDEKQELSRRLGETSEKVFELTTEIELMKSQHGRDIQEWKVRATGSNDVKRLNEKLEKSEGRCKQLEEALNLRSSQGRQLLIGMFA